jgi:hypothetical protein|tara:strand:+ start:232 stop:459 length:228 start_codon:yes stop_codon:yes gene_type:complete
MTINEIEAAEQPVYFVAYSGSNEYIVRTLDPGLTFATSHTLISADNKQEVIDQASVLGMVIEPEDFEDNYEDDDE